jgi:hypothetical protein
MTSANIFLPHGDGVGVFSNIYRLIVGGGEGCEGWASITSYQRDTKSYMTPIPPISLHHFSAQTVYPTLIEMLGEFFLIYDEGRRCKVIYDDNIFHHI